MTDDPFALFDAWFTEAKAGEPNDPEAMALATADARGQSSVRMVLLKGHGRDGFVFYTNLESHKGSDLAENPQAALLFHWKSLRRQVRVEGHVELVTDAEADAYFASRSRDSQLGACASDQSHRLDDRSTFEARLQEVKEFYDGGPVARPSYWGGFRVVPRNIEFWQDRDFRLHERRFFEAQKNGFWSEGLLYP